MEERKAEYFAAKMLIGDVNSYYNSLDDNNFEDNCYQNINKCILRNQKMNPNTQYYSS